MKVVCTTLSLINNLNCFTFNQMLTSWENGLAEMTFSYFNRLGALRAFLLGLIITSEKIESN